jgi:hypothetical protein
VRIIPVVTLLISGYNNRMEFFLNDPNIPRLPPEETHFIGLQAERVPDKNFFRVTLELTPFKESPEIEIKLVDGSGTVISSASIIEPATWKLEISLHIRKIVENPENYTLSATLSYPEMEEVDRISIPIAASESVD